MGALVATVALMTPAAVLMLAISRQYERFVTTTMHNAFCPG
jgi:chromate transport protein ChrA